VGPVNYVIVYVGMRRRCEDAGLYHRNLMQSYHHHLLVDFHHFMHKTHGMCWPYQLDYCRLRRALTHASRVLLEVGPPAWCGRKRQRGVTHAACKKENKKVKVVPFVSVSAPPINSMSPLPKVGAKTTGATGVVSRCGVADVMLQI
jgi:hypothetical protein